MILENELKLTCPGCSEKIATIRHLEGSVKVVFCEQCGLVGLLDDWIAWKHGELAEPGLLDRESA